jgi:hypothetical protein
MQQSVKNFFPVFFLTFISNPIFVFLIFSFSIFFLPTQNTHFRDSLSLAHNGGEVKNND